MLSLIFVFSPGISPDVVVCILSLAFAPFRSLIRGTSSLTSERHGLCGDSNARPFLCGLASVHILCTLQRHRILLPC